MKIFFLSLIIAAAPTFFAHAGVNGAPAKTPIYVDTDIVDTAVNAGNFKTLVALLAKNKDDNFVALLKSKGPFTVFAPTDAAFARLKKNSQLGYDQLFENFGILSETLKYHVAEGKFFPEELIRNKRLLTFRGREVQINAGGFNSDRIFIDNAEVLGNPIVTKNGIIYVIEDVLDYELR